MSEARHLPWNTPPSGLGATRCAWCGRDIYLPALPCSMQVVEGLEITSTAPGFGERCKWEVATRTNLLGSDQ